ncbi:MAG: ECF-type sigma factor [Gemmataceae bacterium]
MNEFTEIVQAIHAGDPRAAERLWLLVYDELRSLAASYLAKEQPGQTLQPTALVHEAYLRLVGASGPQAWNSRGHFFSAAAIAIRRILIDNARRKQSLKHGAEFVRQEWDPSAFHWPEPREDLLALDVALEKLRLLSPEAAELVHLRYFVGQDLAEAAEILGVSVHRGRRIWTYARSWLRREIEDAQVNS